MREAERVGELVQPFTLQEKMTLIERLALNIMPPMLLGLAESYVLAEAELARPYLYVVCRRVRLAIALPAVQTDADGQPYDYDTLVLHLAHWIDRRSPDVSLVEVIDHLPGVTLHRPTDCIIRDGYLFISDGGGDQQKNRLHVWTISAPASAEP
jgi:hypothetical protein